MSTQVSEASSTPSLDAIHWAPILMTIQPGTATSRSERKDMRASACASLAAARRQPKY
jgi:hypothetical protein